MNRTNLRSGAPLARFRAPAGERPPAPARALARTIYGAPIGPVFRCDILEVASRPSGPGFKTMLQQVAAKHQVSANEILSPRRQAYLQLARKELFFRLRHETTLSYPQIGRLVGNRDHSTALHAARQYAKLLAEGRVHI
ncbi:MAG: hypothetical protein JWM36_4361 [Hyphomicrobiales bacterium]|nr:hypothetical protein [Hyphomicrobiales bacterium]